MANKGRTATPDDGNQGVTPEQNDLIGGTGSWVQLSLNQLHDRFEKLDDRLHRVERKMWIAIGAAAVIAAFASFLGTIAWQLIKTVLPALVNLG